jgi:GTP cyclohydrolase IA
VGINKGKIALLYGEIMDELGIKKTPDNHDTPMRVAKSLIEMTENIDADIWKLIDQCTVFDNNSKGITLEQDDIYYSSMCSHHHLPFFGKVKITYKPSKKIIGLSKFQRIVDFFSKKPQVQEDFTEEIGTFLVTLLEPLYVKVEVYDSLHTCMCARGVKSSAKTSTKFEYTKQKVIDFD